MTQSVIKEGFKKNGFLETRKNAKVYITDLLDCRRQRLNSMWEKRYISHTDFDREMRELNHAISTVNSKL